ncbi:MAG TPA: flagellar motor protein MotB [Opitutales bacterium]|mgnify:CR=1 FL=1|nr:flagellar motor protein MotB [Opitutales bacterium]
MGKKHAAHHGGAWKVAYADFVTAMMALFMVLWISAQDQEILITTSRYFQNPFNSPMERSSGVMTGDQAGGRSDANQMNATPSSVVDMAFLHQLANDLYRLLDVQSVDKEEKPMDITVVSDGLRIDLFNRKNQPFFKPYTAEFTPWGELVVQNLAWLMDRYDTTVSIDSWFGGEFLGAKPNYGPWELSSDRANAMRRGLVHYALDPEKIDRVAAHVIPAVPGSSQQNDDTSQRIEVSLVMRDGPK